MMQLITQNQDFLTSMGVEHVYSSYLSQMSGGFLG